MCQPMGGIRSEFSRVRMSPLVRANFSDRMRRALEWIVLAVHATSFDFTNFISDTDHCVTESIEFFL